MSIYERINTAGLVTSLLVLAWYALQVVPQMSEMPVAEIAYTRPMIYAVVIGVILSIVTAIVVSVGSAIWLAIKEGEDAVDADFGNEDERDKHIGRLGDAMGGHLLSVAVIGAMVLIWMDFDTFWVANSLFVGAWSSAVVGTVIKLVAYRGAV